MQNKEIRIIILTSFLSFFLCCLGSWAMEDYSNDQTTTPPPKSKYYFHRKAEESALNNMNNSPIQEKKSGVENERIDSKPTQKKVPKGRGGSRSNEKEARGRSKSIDSLSSKPIPLETVDEKNADHGNSKTVKAFQDLMSPRVFREKSKKLFGIGSSKEIPKDQEAPMGMVIMQANEVQDEPSLEKENSPSQVQINLDDPNDTRPRPLQRQRSWGKHPNIVHKEPKVGFSVLSGDSLEELSLSSQGCSNQDVMPSTDWVIPSSATGQNHQLPKSQNRQSQKGLSQKRIQNPLQRGLSSTTLHIFNLEGQPQDLSPRNFSSASPRNLSRISPRDGSKISPRNESRISPRDGSKISPRHLPMGEEQLQQQKLSKRPSDEGEFLQKIKKNKIYEMRRGDNASEDLSEDSTSASTRLWSQSGTENASLLQEQRWGKEQFQSALMLYRQNRGDAVFMKVMDELSFSPSRLPIVGCGVVGGLLFAVPCGTPMTAVAMNLTGDILKIPVGGWESTVLVSVFMTTFTLAVGTEGYERGQIIGRSIQACLPWGNQLEKVVVVPVFAGQYRWKIGYENYLINSTALVMGAFTALLPTTLLPLVWAKNYPDLILPFVFFLFLRKAEEGYTLVKQTINDAFESQLDQGPEGEFVYTENAQQYKFAEEVFFRNNVKNHEQARKHKIHLLEMNQQFRSEMERNKDVAEEAYRIIQDEKDIIEGKSINQKQFFALSALLGKEVEGDGEDVVAITRRIQEKSSSLSKLENALGYMKILYNGIKIVCKGGSTLISTPIIVEYGLEIFSEYLFPGSWVTKPLAYSLTGLIFTSNLITECLNTIEDSKAIRDYNAHKVSFTHCRNVLSSASLSGTISSVGAVVPAGFCTLIGVSLGFYSLDRWGVTTGWQTLMMAPYVVNEFPPQFYFQKSKLEGFMIATVTTLPETVSTLSGYVSEKCIPKALKRFLRDEDGSSSCCSCFSKCIPKRFMGDDDGSSSCCGCFSKCISSIKAYASLYRKRCWLRNWSNNLHHHVKTFYDTITNATLYFTTQTEAVDQYYEEESGDGDGVEYYEDEGSATMFSEGSDS